MFKQCSEYPSVTDSSSLGWVAKEVLGPLKAPLTVVFSERWSLVHDVVLCDVKSLYIIVEKGATWPDNIRQVFHRLEHVAVQSGSLVADDFLDAFCEGEM